MTPRIRSLSVKGFRAYGAAEQTLNLPADLAVVWGPNSKGKTSLAEAFEFLLTGRITRRELMASTQDEFADALRNAHLAAGEEVHVAARITASDGTTHEIRRVLTDDYAKRRDCASRLEIDGSAAIESDLGSFGIALSQPPLQAPVLAQHTLSYIFSVGPLDRATYFKALLEVTDLDDLRNDIAALADELKTPNVARLTQFDSCAGVPALQPVLSRLLHTIPDLAALTVCIEDAARALIESAGAEVPATLGERIAMIDMILTDRRSKTFPVREFERRDLAGWEPPSSDTWTKLDSYLNECKAVDEDARQLVALFDEALKIPAVSTINEPVDCPLCATESALTPERVKLIRQYVEGARDFKVAEAAAKSALSQLSASAKTLATATGSALPRYLKTTTVERRKIGFTVGRILELLGDRAAEIMDPWLAKVRIVARAGAALQRKVTAVSEIFDGEMGRLGTTLEPEKLRAAFSQLAVLYGKYTTALEAYKGPAATLGAALNSLLDAQSDTEGWQDFLDVARQPHQLRTALIDRAAHMDVAKELDAAIRQIDRAREQVLEDKFADYSDLIQAWWERLRPDEPTYFSAVQPRKGAKRTIDFKAGLSPNQDRSAPKVRDVIAVFSQSQLHCLGLAVFLARAQHEGFGFIILDDPILSSDEDYRVHFNSTVLNELLKLPMQVVVLTQDHATWEELEIRYRHCGVSTAQLFVDAPSEGSIIENTSDALSAKINRARSLARGGHPDVRKQCGLLLRDAGERFCKEMLVGERLSKGEIAASLTDYDGKPMEWLCPHVDPLLVGDPSHPGKLAAFKKTVNDACHDNAPPSNAAMTQACGDMAYLAKAYLGR